ncbi:hypothetical protein [Streptomyces sp. NPDC051219]|uniref:hypothetical protein n=1 Tax=Streptomyces sp. NPDC051219 TaxID=3155283 RepID=UPI00343AA53C
MYFVLTMWLFTGYGYGRQAPALPSRPMPPNRQAVRRTFKSRHLTARHLHVGRWHQLSRQATLWMRPRDKKPPPRSFGPASRPRHPPAQRSLAA